MENKMKESAAFDQEKKAWFAPLLCTVERGRFEVGGKLLVLWKRCIILLVRLS